MPMNNDLISRSALLEELKEQHDYIMQDPEVGKTMKWCEAVCFHRTVETVESAPAVDAGTKWFSVKDRLPEVWKDVLTHRAGGHLSIEFKCSGDGWSFDNEIMEEVTHWMPLPEPPGEQKPKYTITAATLTMDEHIRFEDLGQEG